MSTVTGFDSLTIGRMKAVVSKMGGVKNVFAFLRDEYKLIKVDRPPYVISLAHTPAFNSVILMGKGSYTLEEDKRSVVLTEIDLTDVKLKTMRGNGEQPFRGEERRG